MKPWRDLVDLITQTPRSPVRQMVFYYALLFAVGALLVTYVPQVREAMLGNLFAQVTGPTSLREVVQESPITTPVAVGLTMVILMTGTLLLTIPVSWGFMAIRERAGFDQSVVQTIVILPTVVAAIMMIVQHSLALAFALAGVAAAVRFRNTLKDVADATYIFLAIGVGIAAGVGALAAAAVMSVIFNFASVLLWRCDYGRCPTTLAVATVDEVRARVRKGQLSIRVKDAAAARTGVEDALDRTTRKWKLNRIEPVADGGATLLYRVRLKKSRPPSTVVDQIVAGDAGVVSAAFDLAGAARGG